MTTFIPQIREDTFTIHLEKVIALKKQTTFIKASIALATHTLPT